MLITKYEIICSYCDINYDNRYYVKQEQIKPPKDDTMVQEIYLSHGICPGCLPGVMKENGLESLIEDENGI